MIYPRFGTSTETETFFDLYFYPDGSPKLDTSPRGRRDHAGKTREEAKAMYCPSAQMMLKMQGIGLHPDSRVTEAIVDDLVGMAAYLEHRHATGRGPFLFGRRPSSYDATLFGSLGVLLGSPFSHPIAQTARGLVALVRYVRHVQTTFFADGYESEMAPPFCQPFSDEPPAPKKKCANSPYEVGDIPDVPDHCCLRCKNQNGADHGPRCKRKLFVPPADE